MLRMTWRTLQLTASSSQSSENGPEVEETKSTLTKNKLVPGFSFQFFKVFDVCVSC